MDTVGRLAKRFGLSRSTLLYYDSIGLLRPTAGGGGEYRRYNEADAARLAKICTYRKAGVPLKDIARLLDGPESALGAVLEERLEALNEEILALRQQQRLVAALLSRPDLPDGVMDKATWTALLAASGFSEADMRSWHEQFERRAPETHHRFLRFLGIPEEEIATIRVLPASSEAPAPSGPHDPRIGDGRRSNKR